MAKRKPNRKQVRASRSKAEPQTARRKAKPRRERAPRGQVGPQAYDAVRKIVEEKKLPIGKAFEEVANLTGRQPGTVAVSYYRIARLKGGSTRKRRGGRTAGRKTHGAKAAAGRVGSVLSRVSEAIRELEEVIAHQAEEISRLRGESKLRSAFAAFFDRSPVGRKRRSS
jgi:hypothetical protein